MTDRLTVLHSLMERDPGTLAASLENFIRGAMENLSRDGIILGLSGGIDSAVLASLSKRAVGEKKILALVMPEKDSEKIHIQDALDFARIYNIKTKLVDISPYLKKFGTYKLLPLSRIPLPGKLRKMLTRRAYHYYERKTGETPFSASLTGLRGEQFSSLLKKGNAYYRIKHRIRMVLLYLYGELENRLVVGAANKTEYKIGYFVKHGCDDAVDIMPLLGLFKSQVRDLARYLNIPSRVIDKAPSPDIIPGIIDEEAIGIAYEILDLVLLALEKGWEISEIADVLEVEEEKVVCVQRLTRNSEHMRKIYVPDQ